MKEEKTPNYNEEGIENLTNAIILQAVKDYRNALKNYRKALKDFSLSSKSSIAIADCERFFRSAWYRQLTNVDGEYLITNIRKEYPPIDEYGDITNYETKENQSDS